MTLALVILAAGQGTRMKSNQPKVLHKLAGKSLLTNVLLKAKELNPKICTVVHGHKSEEVKTTILSELNFNNKDFSDAITWVEQTEQLGTGHAVITALRNLEAKYNESGIDQVLVLYGDVPLVHLSDLNKLISTVSKDELGLLTLNSSNPYGLGRIIRNDEGAVTAIVEQKEANSQEKLISEVNTGIFLLPYPVINTWLNDLNTNNSQNEYYLTDVVDMAVHSNVKINTITVSDQDSYLGINTLYQLASAERHYQYLKAVKLLECGVKVIDPKRIDVRGDLTAEQDVVVDINCIFEGEVKLGKNTVVESNCILRNTTVGNNVHIKANSIIEDSIIANNCIVGPFARIRPGTNLSDNVHVGNFVEVKKSNIGVGSKANHLSYIGDSEIGCHVNIGAGVITCNYDGVNKHKTIINDNAFVGSNCSLVAPITIGEGATIGAGSTITKDAPENKLSIAREKQYTVDSWQRKDKK